MLFSPQPSTEIATFATAEIAIYCTESSVLLLIAKLQSFISETDLFQSDYLRIRYPGNDNKFAVQMHITYTYNRVVSL